MKLAVISKLSDPSRDINEDLVGYSDSYCWVLDGATGLTNTPLTKYSNDARWYVERVDAALRQFSGSKITSPSLQEIVHQAITQVGDEFKKSVVRTQFLPYEVPSSGMALIRVRENYLDYGILGDCKVFILRDNGEQLSLGESPLEKLDKHVIDQLSLLHRQGIKDSVSIKTNIMPMLQKNRSLMNVENGYWILSFVPKAAKHMCQGTVKIKHDDTILVVTDGFYRIVDTFKQIQEINFVQSALEKGLSSILEDIRALEKSDLGCLIYPRIKASDDATAVLLTVSED